MSLTPLKIKGPTINSIDAFPVAPRWVFVRVEDSEGIVGWGEGTLEGATSAVLGAVASLKGQFEGFPVDGIEDIWQVATRSAFYRPQTALLAALSGIDIALWDIKGKRLGVPIHSLLGGGVRERLKVYGWIGGDRPGDVERMAKERKEAGFTAVKMNATEDMGWLDSPLALASSAERLKNVRALGLDAGMDFHGRMHAPMARQLAKILEEHTPLFIEEPLLPSTSNIENLKLIKSLVSTPIALGERLYRREDFLPYLIAGAVDIVQPDVSHVGGISELRRIATLAEAFDVAFAPHCPNGPLSLAASIHVDAVSMNFAIQEMSLKIHYNVGADLETYIKNPEVFKVTDGYVEIPSGKGLGVEIDEEKVREAAKEWMKREKEWYNPGFRSKREGEFREW
ncbi:enolase C-terminal domain-like protein [Atractiella rhizophila]|nr:enolase C-terminal domain-like protein [Atractiella rhizophila]